jgi:hypothetical protein
MQGTDPTGGSGDSRVMDKVCAVNFSCLSSDYHTLTVNGSVTSGPAAMSFLKRSRLENLARSFLPENDANRLGNLLSLDLVCHNSFDGLSLWFEHTEKVHHFLTS